MQIQGLTRIRQPRTWPWRADTPGDECCVREDLLARINLWTYPLPGLAERREEIEPNLRYELDQFTTKTSTRVTFNKEAGAFSRLRYFSGSTWSSNFRDLNAAVTRMSTLVPGGRINATAVDEENARLRRTWRRGAKNADDELLSSVLDPDRLAEFDLFDQVQLAEAIRVCRRCRYLAEAGRHPFAVSLRKRMQANDADRLRKYLAWFGLEWEDVQPRGIPAVAGETLRPVSPE